MALVWTDSFDHYLIADLLEKWNTLSTGDGNTSIQAAGGRHSSGSIRITANSAPFSTATLGVQKLLVTTGPVFVVGFALKPSTNMSGVTGLPLFSIRDGLSAQITLRVNANMTLSVVRGIQNGTVLGTTTATLTIGVFTYIELRVAIDPAVGTVELRLNGVPVAPFPLINQNTRNTVNSAWTGIALGTVDSVANTWLTAGFHDYDDLYVLDGSGIAPWNDFLGDVRVDPRFSIAAGATTGWTPSAGSNFQNVDEATPNDDTDYNSTPTTGLTDTFVVQDTPVAGSIVYGIQHNIYVKKMDAGLAGIAPVTRHAGVDNVGVGQAPGVNYAYITQINQTNPGTGLQWTEADFNAAEFGYKKTF